MSAPLVIAIVMLGLDGLAAAGVAAYAVRRLPPWPKPPVQAQPRTPPAASAAPPGDVS